MELKVSCSENGKLTTYPNSILKLKSVSLLGAFWHLCRFGWPSQILKDAYHLFYHMWFSKYIIYTCWSNTVEANNFNWVWGLTFSNCTTFWLLYWYYNLTSNWFKNLVCCAVDSSIPNHIHQNLSLESEFHIWCKNLES